MSADEFKRKYPNLVYCPIGVPLTREQLNELFSGNQEGFINHLVELVDKHNMPQAEVIANG